jgi:hypothetical protein
MKAAAHGHAALVRTLIARGADPNLRDAQGSTALHAAAHMGYRDVITLLLTRGASVDVRDADGESVADWARDADIARLLEGQSFAPRVLDALLDASQIDRLLALRSSVLSAVHDDGAGHEVIFLHAERAKGLLSDECAAVLDGLAAAMRAHDPREGDLAKGLAVRCVELHTYSAGGGLMDKGHKDSGSALSLSVMLSDPSGFDGGQFITWEGAEHEAPVYHAVGRGCGVLFRSEDLHNVSPVTRGTRHVLVLELWYGRTNEVDRNR